MGKKTACCCRRHKEAGLILGLGRFARKGHGNPLQYSYLENSINRGPGRVRPKGFKESDMIEAT